MLFYLSLLALIIILAVLVKNKKVLLLISLVILIAVYTFRSVNVGWDTKAYVDMFMESPKTDISSTYIEPGWLYLNKAIFFISPTKTFFFFVVGSLSLCLAFFVFYKTSKSLGTSIILFFMFCYYTRLMNTQRNDLAVCICMLSFYLTYKKKYIPAIIVNLVAITIHKSAFVFLLFIIASLFIKKFTFKTLFLFIAITLLVFILFDPIFSFLTRFMYSGYADRPGETETGALRFFVVYLLLFAAVIVMDKNKILAFSFITNRTEEMRLDTMLYCAMCFSLFFQLLSLKNAMISRFSNYFFAFFPIVIANSIYNIKRSRNLVVKTFVPAAIYGVLFIWMIINLKFAEGGFGKDNVIPYTIDSLEKAIIWASY